MQVSREVMQVLDRCTLSGAHLVLPEQLDRKLYEATNKVLVAAGGKWNRKAGAHVFPGQADDAMEQILLTGEVTVPQDFDYFPTPPEVVARLLDLADVRAQQTVLEPSAGRGSIAHEAGRRGAWVTAVELLQENSRHLDGALLPRIATGDFLALRPEDMGLFDRVVMNPPFSKQADIVHVLHALTFLRPTGRLVAVMGAGVEFRNNARTVAFRQLVERRGGTIERLPEKSFRSSGTDVNTVVVVIPGSEAEE